MDSKYHEYLTQIQELKKEIGTWNSTAVQELKSKKVFIGKNELFLIMNYFYNQLFFIMNYFYYELFLKINSLKKMNYFSLENIKDDPNSVWFYTGFKKYDTLIAAVFECLEPQDSRMHFWEGRDKYNDGTLKYQNENINKPGNIYC